MNTTRPYLWKKGLIVSVLLTQFMVIGAFAQQLRPINSNRQQLEPTAVDNRFADDYRDILTRYDQDRLQQLKEEFIQKETREKAEALAKAQELGFPVRIQNSDGSFDELQKLAEDGSPVYYALHNVDAAISTRADYLNTGGGLSLNVNGNGLTAYVWDGGPTRPTHQEFDGAGGNNRVAIFDGATTLNGNSFHAQHVTGTIVASGFVAAAKGMAWQADAETSDWNSDLSEATTAASGGMLISNHSYGYNASSIPDSWFGQYGSDGRDWDNLMYNAPYYLMVCSAGNDGNDNTSNGSPLGGNSSYDKLNGTATAKNNMVVANGLDANINPDGSLNSVSRNTGSSEGPTDDLRIKPDIMGNGTGLYSCYDNSDSAYNSISGTSMSSPNVAGSILLLQEHYNNVNGSFMRAATAKGLTLHTADDVAAAGPDATTGWGLMNTKFAAETITTADAGGYAIISELNLSQGQTYQIQIESNGVDDLMASISWTDPAGTVNNGTNSSTPALVNDLDIRLSDGSTYTPWRLTGVTTNGTGDNTVDPFERIDVTGASGIYTLTVTHKGTLSGGSQNFTLIVTGARPAPLSPEISFASTTATQVEGSDCSYVDVNVQLNVGLAPSANADVNFTVNGSSTAITDKDFALLTPSVTFPAGSTATQNMTLRVYHDGFIESDETVTIDFTVNPNGGDATANTNADSFTLTISDNDTAPVASVDEVLASYDMGDLSGWQALDDDGDGNNWIGLTGLSWPNIDGSFVGSETDLTILGGPGAGTANADNYLISPAVTISPSATNVEFQYGVGGYLSRERYATYWTTDLTNATTMQQLQLENRNSANNADQLRTVNVGSIAGQTGYFVIRHFNSSANSGILLFDNLQITQTVTTQVQTAVNAGATEANILVNDSGTVYTADSSSGDVMLDITNNGTFDYGCVNVGVSRAGTSAQTYQDSSSPNLVTDKTFEVVAANTTLTGNVDVLFYFTETEIAGWEAATGLSRNQLVAARNNGSLVETSALTIGAFGSHVTLSGSFTGLEGTYYFGPSDTFGPCPDYTQFTGSWSNGSPASNAKISIRSNYNSLSDGGSLDGCEIVVSNNATVTIGANDFLRVNGNITVESGSTLIIEHQGSLVQVDGSALATNNGVINVNLTTPTLDRDDWMALGSPMTAETRADGFGPVRRVMYHIPSNFTPNPGVGGTVTNFQDADRNFWRTLNSGGSLNPGEGYLVFPVDSDGSTRSLTFDTGTLNNGDVTHALVYNGASNPNGTPNILSNPYASPVDADAFLSANSGISELYFWEHLTAPDAGIPGPYDRNYSMDDISVYNLSGGTAAANDGTGTATAPNGVISTFQGFGVRASANGTATFTNAMRLTTGNTTLRQGERLDDRLWLRLSSDAYDYPLGSNVLIAFNPLASAGMDPGYDTDRLDSSVSLYSQIEGTNKQLSIQTREGFDQDIKVSLGMSSYVTESIEYRISLTQLEGSNLEGRGIYLVDNLLGEIVDLTQGDYTFRGSEGDQPGRFTLQFEYEVLSTAEVLADQIGLYPNPTDGLLNIVAPGVGINSVSVYDLQGRLVTYEQINVNNVFQLDVNKLNTAVYLLVIDTDRGEFRKQFVKR